LISYLILTSNGAFIFTRQEYNNDGEMARGFNGRKSLGGTCLLLFSFPHPVPAR
jgi:hypothetical protein